VEFLWLSDFDSRYLEAAEGSRDHIGEGGALQQNCRRKVGKELRFMMFRSPSDPRNLTWVVYIRSVPWGGSTAEPVVLSSEVPRKRFKIFLHHFDVSLQFL